MMEELHVEKKKDLITNGNEEKTDIVEVETKSTADMTEAETEVLMDAVRKQVEYYFSKENLQSDAYLTSHMDANMTVAIATVMKFAKMKALTTDEALLRKALERSTINIVDDRIKPNIKAAGRSTIILREIPSDTDVSEVREIFAFEGCKQISSMRSDIGDTWFVLMDSEDDAKDTLLDLRLKKRMFRGQSVKGRLKSETVVRSFYPVQAAPSMPPAIYPGMQMQYAGGFVPGPMPIDMRYGSYNMGQMAGMMAPMGQQGSGNMMAQPLIMEMAVHTAPAPPSSSQEDIDTKTESTSQNTKDRRAPYVPAVTGTTVSAGSVPQGSGGSSSTGNYKGAATSGAAGGSSMGSRDGAPRDRNGKNGTASGSRQSSSGGKDSSRTTTKGGPKTGTVTSGTTQRASIEINSANFPPLQNSHSNGEDGPIPIPGYQGQFIKYSFDDIINIVKDIKDTSLPASIKPTEHLFAMTATANMDLLKRQRTFSIDETREQLKQGRPVQREAVLAGGAGDYSSMIYGDKEAVPPGSGNQTETLVTPTVTEKVEKEREKEIVEMTKAMALEPATSVSASTAAPVVPSDVKKVPASGSWAAMVASNATAAATQTAAAASAVRAAPRATGSKDSAPPSPDRKQNGRVASSTNGTSSAKKASAGSTSGSVTGEKGLSDKSRDRRRGADRKDGDRKEGERSTRGAEGERRDRGGRERTPNSKSTRRSDNVPAAAATEESSNVDTDKSSSLIHGQGAEESQSEAKDGVASQGEKTPVLGWGTKPTFANILKQQQTAEAAVASSPHGTSKRTDKQTMIPLSSPSGQSSSDLNGVSDKEHKDRETKGEKPARDRSVQQPAGVVANKKAGIAAGVWAKETLPPLKSAPQPQSDA